MRRLVLGLVSVLVVGAVPAAGVAATPVLVHRPLLRATGRATAYSTNWSGYADQAATFSDVKGSWTQPSVSCASRSRAYASFWVGLDGYTSNSVEQTGTDSDCAGRNRPVYYAWYEMYPALPVTLSNRPVAPGDSMSGEVSAFGTLFTVTVTDHTRGWTFTTSQTVTGAQRSSAEWVAEAPSNCASTCTVLPLANFGTMSFAGAATTGNGTTGTISSFHPDEIVMVTTNGTIKALPSALNTAGTGFSDAWHHS
jgi:hypothetical protein